MNTAQVAGEYLHLCQRNGASPGTIANKQSILRRFAQDFLEIPQAPEPIFRFLATCGKSQATRKTARDHVRAFYAFACQKYDLVDPMPQVAVPLRGTKRSRGRTQDIGMGGGGTHHKI